MLCCLNALILLIAIDYAFEASKQASKLRNICRNCHMLSCIAAALFDLQWCIQVPRSCPAASDRRES